jgi:hypothetical protein
MPCSDTENISDKNASKCPNVFQLSPGFTLSNQSTATAASILKKPSSKKPRWELSRKLLSYPRNFIPSQSPIRATSLSTKDINIFCRGHGSSDTANRQTSERDSSSGHSRGGAILVILLDDHAVLGDA